MKNKVYLILYYLISLVIIPLCILYCVNYINIYELTNSDSIQVGMGNGIYAHYISFHLIVISLILCIITTVLVIKNKKINITNKDLVLVISYILFIILIVICCIGFDKKIIVPGMEYYYYINLILLPYIFVNVDIWLSIKKKKK